MIKIDEESIYRQIKRDNEITYGIMLSKRQIELIIISNNHKISDLRNVSDDHGLDREDENNVFILQAKELIVINTTLSQLIGAKEEDKK